MIQPTVTSATYDRWASAVEIDQQCELAAASLIFNPSPERDSLLEDIAVARRAAPELVAPMIPRVERLRRLVLRGFEIERPLVPEISDMCRRTRGYELNGRSPRALTAKAVSRRLREPLAVLVAGTPPSDGDGRALAWMELGAIFRDVPDALLRSDAVAYNLAPRKAAKLQELLDLRAAAKKRGAAGKGGSANRTAEDAGDRGC